MSTVKDAPGVEPCGETVPPPVTGEDGLLMGWRARHGREHCIH